MDLVNLFVFSTLFLVFYFVDPKLCDLKNYDLIVIPNLNFKSQKPIRVPGLSLDLSKYLIVIKILDIGNSSNIFVPDEDEQINYDFKKETTQTRNINNNNEVFIKSVINKRQKNRNSNNELKIRKINQQELLANKVFANQNHFVYVPKLNSVVSDYNKKINSDEDYSYEYKTKEIDRIIGGIAVDISLHPYHVQYGPCGGSIIHKKWIITAAHCPKFDYIRAGSKYFDAGHLYFIKNHYVHPGWTYKSKTHEFDWDYQLLELEKSLKFTRFIKPVKIGLKSDMTIGKMITVTGWGSTFYDGPLSYVLREVRLPMISKQTCQKVQFPYFEGTLTDRMFCAGYKDGRKDACQGDSGGPAVANNTLMGLVSFGYGCATPESYGVYSLVPQVRRWIRMITRLKL